MPHQLSQYVDRCSGVGVALSVAVAVGVEKYRGLVEFGAVGAAKRCQIVDPAAVGSRQRVVG
jgi:hypothetical protein